MRRTFSRHRPILLLSLFTQILCFALQTESNLWVVDLAQAASTITPTTSTPGNLGTVVAPNGNMYGITGGKQVGNNLYHSFSQFNVGTGDTAQYQTTNLLPNPNMQNILSRVTGGSPSSIFGTIDSATFYPSANFFFINPTGILFGPNAMVNVGGMVAFTTADYLRLGDGKLFNAIANTNADALLSASPVAAFGFLGSNPAAIAVQGSTLIVAPGQTLSLVGGNQGFTYTNPDTSTSGSIPNGMSITGGNVLAPGGQVNIASVASPGEVVAGTMDYGPNVAGQTFGTLGTINISEQSLIDVSGNGGGTVLIRGGNFVLDNSTISSSVLGPAVGTPGAGINIVMNEGIAIQNLATITTLVTPGNNVKGGDTH